MSAPLALQVAWQQSGVPATGWSFHACTIEFVSLAFVVHQTLQLESLILL